MLLDTSGFLCLNDRTERFHTQAVQEYRQRNRGVTHNYVLAEFVALSQARGFPRSVMLSYLTALHANADIQVIWVEEGLHLDAMALLAARSDKTYSLCDAMSFLLMRRLRIVDALTTDRHFEQEGFRQLLQ